MEERRERDPLNQKLKHAIFWTGFFLLLFFFYLHSSLKEKKKEKGKRKKEEKERKKGLKNAALDFVAIGSRYFSSF